MINFLNYKKVYFSVSVFFLLISILSLISWGLRPSIDFTGGSLLELKFAEDIECQVPSIRDGLEDGKDMLVAVQQSEENCLLKLENIDDAEKNMLVQSLKRNIGEVAVVRFETVGPTLGRELLTKTIIAIVLAVSLIMLYAAWQFKDFMYGVCAVLAMLHDTTILLGSFAFFGYFWGVSVDTLFVTAVLTTLSLSVHDTVVVFNSVRKEAEGHRGNVSPLQYDEIVNRAMNDTIVRALGDSFTIMFMLLCLVLLGGQTIHWFSVALFIGTILGTYSSTFVATPLLTVWYRNLS